LWSFVTLGLWISKEREHARNDENPSERQMSDLQRFINDELSEGFTVFSSFIYNSRNSSD
jgi:hypothetical protein